MTNFPQDKLRYTRRMAVEIANVTMEFLERCETAQLISVRTVQEGEPGYSVQDIRRLALIYRLHDVLGIDFQDLEVVLHLRSQLMQLQEQLKFMERQMLAREERLRGELAELRRQVAEDVD